MKVITMLNQKGGVGKTSCTHHLAGTLAAMGRRVLLLDNDPQSSLSQGFWGPDAVRALEPSETIAAIYDLAHPFPAHLIRQTGITGIDLVPGSMSAKRFNNSCPEESPLMLQGCLRDFLAEASEDYDLVLIDCPPNLHLCSWAALVASDYLVVPLQPEDYGAQGIIEVQESIAMVQAGPNPGLEMLGYLLTMVAREKIQEVFTDILRTNFGTDVFAATVPRSPVYKEAIAARRPIQQYKPKGVPAQAIRAVAEELIARIESPRFANLREAV